MKKTKPFKMLLMAALITVSGSVFAQVKIGTNPTAIGTNSNLEVESTSGNKTVIQKDNGDVGIGTSTPGNKLEVNQGTSGQSGLRLKQINNTTTPVTTNVAPLGVNNTGDVVVIKTPSVFAGTATVGDIVEIANSSIPVSGFFTSANKYGQGTAIAYTVVGINFPNLGTTDYIVNASYEAYNGLGGGNNASTVRVPVIRNKTATSFEIYMLENSAVGQDIKLNIMIVKN